MQTTQVRELMEAQPVMIRPDSSLEEAARMMKEADCGFLPVGSDDSVEGIITDRDIVIRAIAEGKNPSDEKVMDYMTEEVCACNESATLEDAARMMSENNVSRLIVKDEQGRCCGVLTFGRMIRSNDDRQETSEVVEQATKKAA